MKKYKLLKKLTVLLFCALLSTLVACGSGGDGEFIINTPTDDGSGQLPTDNGPSQLSLTLAWDPSPDSDIVGYNVYYSDNTNFEPGVLGAEEGASPIRVDLVTSATITGLYDDTVHYFTVTARDSDGNESSYSNIVSTR